MVENENGALLPLRAMALRLGIHPRELRAEADRGGVPFVRVGSRGLLFDAELVLAHLRARAQPSQTGEEVPRAAS